MANFVIYTFQFEPIREPLQLDLFNDVEYHDPEESMKRKLSLLDSCIPEKGDLSMSRARKTRKKKDEDERKSKRKDKSNPAKPIETSHKGYVIWKYHDIALLRVANKRKKVIEDNFEKYPVDDHPSCYVIVDNRENHQQIAIQSNANAFANTDTVADILRHTFNKNLEKYRIRMTIDARYTVYEFYNNLEKYKGKIRSIQFFFPSPNLERLSSEVKKTLNKVAEETNTKPMVELMALEGQQMTFDPRSSILKDMVNDCINSGNPIRIKTDKRTIECRKKDAYLKAELDDCNLTKKNEDDNFSKHFDAIMLFLKNLLF